MVSRGHKDECGKRNEKKRERKILPALAAEYKRKERAVKHNANNAPRIRLVKLAHIAFGVVARECRNNGAYKHLGKSARCRKDDSSDNEADVRCIRKHPRRYRKGRKTYDRDKRSYLNRERDIEFVGEKREDKIDRQLCDEVDKD